MGEDSKQIGKPMDAESRAAINIWKYVFGFTDAAPVKCAIDLGIPEAITSSAGDSIMLSQLTSALSNANFDLPHVEADAPTRERVINVGGDMFKEVPKADAAFIMVSKMFPISNASGCSMIGQTDCIQILRNCREAIPREKGKVIIVEAVIEEEEDEEEGEGGRDGLRGVKLALDMVIMAHTKERKDRTRQEWGFLLKEAGFSSHNIKHILAMIQSVIEAFP